MGTTEDARVIPLTMKHIFDRVSGRKDRVFLLRLSCLEFYRGTLYDLLDPKSVAIRKILFAATETVTDAESAINLIFAANGRRRVAATKANARSSRSHTLFKIISLYLYSDLDIGTLSLFGFCLVNTVLHYGQQRYQHV